MRIDAALYRLRLLLRDAYRRVARGLFPMPAELADVHEERWLDLSHFRERERLKVHEARTAAENESVVVRVTTGAPRRGRKGARLRGR